MIGVIIAAGFGSRLWSVSSKIPKTLLPFGGGTILSTIITQLRDAGVDRLVIVVGYNQDYIREYLSTLDTETPIEIIENLEWERGNAISVYKAKEYVNNESFILSMSDHLVCVSALERVVGYSEDDNLLMVDPYIQENFDLDDATKVQVENGFITSIGKKIDHYNSLDCGIFRLNSAFFDAVEKAVESGDESISGAIMQLVNNRCMKAITLDAPNQWIDVDTPEAYEHALNTFKL